MTDESGRSYAHLPEDLILKILNGAPKSVDRMKKMFDSQEESLQQGRDAFWKKGIIRQLGDDVKPTDSVMAADGGHIIEKMAGADLLLAVAVGVEGLRAAENRPDGWLADGNQYYQWQTVLPHDDETPRLCQGVMFLMELSVLAGASYDVKIMDGAHFTPLLKINSMLSAGKDAQDAPRMEYSAALREFLHTTYDKMIPHIPNIIKDAMSDEGIVAIAKYSSSRDLLDSQVRDLEITLDDKTFFTLILEEGEYTRPFPVGQSPEEKERWNHLHIKCNLPYLFEEGEQKEKLEELNGLLDNAIAPIRAGVGKESDLRFTYYKPHGDGPAYRIECKKALVEDDEKFKRMLASIKRQIVYPDIREPFPQYLADLMAKSVSGGLTALQDAILLSPDLSLLKDGRINLLLPYRSK